MVWLLAIISLGASRVIAQACPDITTTLTPDFFEAVTASAGSSVVLQQYGRAELESCAQAFVPGGATVTAQSATLTMSATAFPPAVATVTGAYIPTATVAAITANGPGTISIGPNAAQATIEATGPAQRVTIDAGASVLEAYCRTADCYLTALGVDSGYIQARGPSASAEVTFVGNGYHSMQGQGGGTVSATGPAVTATVDGSGGLGIINGPDASCSAAVSASCFVSGDRATVTAGLPGGFVAIAAGTGGVAEAFNSGTLSIVGDNTATVGVNGFGQVGSGAEAFISSGNGDVFLSSGATGTLQGGATIFSAPGATVTASPNTFFTSIGTRNDYVLLSAMEVVLPSGARKRQDAPVESASACGLFLTDCPNLRGELSCVDVKTDILNCGGCALDGSGMDCTNMNGQGSLACVDGICTAEY